jgi:hypothetical protein
MQRGSWSSLCRRYDKEVHLAAPIERQALGCLDLYNMLQRPSQAKACGDTQGQSSNGEIYERQDSRPWQFQCGSYPQGSPLP